MFKNLKLESSYDTYVYKGDITKEFYEPVLSQTFKYDRASAYLSVDLMKIISKGLYDLYENNGKMRLLISEDLSEEDFNIIKNAYDKEKINKIYSKIKSRFDNHQITEEDKIYFSNIAYLIYIGLIEIKLVFKKSGIYHDKFSLFYDKIGDIIYTKGSDNATSAAINKNIESFDITTTWLSNEFDKKKIKKAQDKFEKYWNINDDECYAIDLPKVIKSNLLKFNRGEMIYTKIPKENSIIIDYKNDNLIAYTTNDIDFNFKNHWYKTEIKSFVKRKYNKLILFNDNIQIYRIEKIIDSLKKYINKENDKNGYIYNLYITGGLKRFIKSTKYEIEQYSKLGKLIKQRDISLEKKLNEFKKTIEKNMVRTLRNSQLWDAYHIVKMVKSANFSVPGAGKTTIIYGAFSYLFQKNKVNKLVVIGPKNSFLSWKDEFKLNFGENLNLEVNECNKNRNTFIEKSVNSNLILINYESLQSLEKNIITILKEYKCFLVFDEVHKIKAINGVRSSIALEISKYAEYKAVLTGTPVPNGYIDIYNMLKILYQDDYNKFFNFSKSYLKESTDLDCDKISQKLYPFFCRTTKKNLNVPLPEPDHLIYVEATDNEKNLYAEIKNKNKSNAFLFFIRIMQAMSNPKLLLNDIDYKEVSNIILDNELGNIDDNKFYNNHIIKRITKEYEYNYKIKDLIRQIGNSSKFNKGIELIENLVNENKNVLVWGCFKQTLRDIQEELNKKSIKSVIIDGSINNLEERENLINDFKNGKYSVLITNPNTLAESVSLHKECHDAIYFEYSFILTHMLQSRDRINRLGLEENQKTNYYYLISDYEDSVDKYIYKRLNEKKNLMLNMIETDKIFISGENINTIRKDIENLLKKN